MSTQPNTSRTFPSLPYILNNSNEPPVYYMGTSPTGSICFAGVDCVTGEDLPSIARTMNFRVSVRDGQGGIADAGMPVAAVNTTTPFKVTTQNTAVSYQGSTAQIVMWDVSDTTAAPISTANVKISLSTDGGQTFPTVLAASTPNDGTQSVTIPNSATTQARIKVEAVGNIFFDINDANFIITSPTAAAISISGRVVLPNDLGATNAIVTLTGASGVSQTTRTGKFGNFIFREVEIGESYILRVSAKRYTFAPIVISPTANLTDIIFTPQ